MSDTPAPKFLGTNTGLPDSPEAAELDYVPNPRAGQLYMVRFAAPEFTSLCPVTGQPDFAHLVIDYAPGETIVESKSLKLFLGSFRNHCGFHEDVTVGIGQRLFDEMQPRWLRIGGYWYPRGGIPIDVFWQSGAPPQDLWRPDQGVASYRGRGGRGTQQGGDARHDRLTGKVPWRRGWDSNPRYCCQYTAFRVQRIRPLCHLSALSGALRAQGPGRSKARRLAERPHIAKPLFTRFRGIGRTRPL